MTQTKEIGLTLFNSMDVTRQSIGETVAVILKAVDDGAVNPLEARIRLKAIEEVVKTASSSIARYVRDEAEKHGTRSFEYMGAKVELAETGVDYNYDVCGDPEWEALQSNMKQLKADIKAREEFLKSLKKPLTVANDETGEIITINPPVKTSTSGVKITIK
jgi:hypothetical protein